jgi:hypothetical protein
MPLAHRAVVRADDRRPLRLRQRRTPDQPQQRVPARGQPEPVTKPGGGSPTKRHAHAPQPSSRALRSTCPGRGDTGQPLGEDAAVTSHIVAKHAADAQTMGNNVLPAWQVSQRPHIMAVGPFGGRAARRAPRRARTGLERECDRRPSGINVPGSELNAGRIWQQQRQKTHPAHMVGHRHLHQKQPRAQRACAGGPRPSQTMCVGNGPESRVGPHIIVRRYAYPPASPTKAAARVEARDGSIAIGGNVEGSTIGVNHSPPTGRETPLPLKEPAGD